MVHNCLVIRALSKNHLGFIGDLSVSDAMRTLRSKDKPRVKLTSAQWKHHSPTTVPFRTNLSQTICKFCFDSLLELDTSGAL